jgi:hypothetical protein
MPRYTQELYEEVVALWNCDFPYKDYGIVNDPQKKKYIELIIGQPIPSDRQIRYYIHNLKTNPFIKKGTCLIKEFEAPKVELEEYEEL